MIYIINVFIYVRVSQWEVKSIHTLGKTEASLSLSAELNKALYMTYFYSIVCVSLAGRLLMTSLVLTAVQMSDDHCLCMCVCVFGALSDSLVSRQQRRGCASRCRNEVAVAVVFWGAVTLVRCRFLSPAPSPEPQVHDQTNLPVLSQCWANVCPLTLGSPPLGQTAACFTNTPRIKDIVITALHFCWHIFLE